MVTSSPNKTIVVYGGSFDPIHLGHIEAIKSLYENFKPARFFLVPTYRHHFKKTVASFHDRVKMVEIATSKLPFEVKVSTIEKKLYQEDEDGAPQFSTTFQTLTYFKNRYPNCRIIYPIGLDLLSELDTWYKIEEVSKLADLCLMNRPWSKLPKNDNLEYISSSVSIKTPVDISSCQIRDGSNLIEDIDVLKYISTKNLYYMQLLVKFLSKKRLMHSISVAETSYDIAVSNGLDKYKCYQAGLFHDVGKDLPKDEQFELMKEFYPEEVNFPRYSYHQFVSAYLAKKYFKVTDDAVLKAMLYHCTGNSNMSEIAKCVYVTDKVEPLRDFPTKMIREQAFKSLDNALYLVLQDQKRYFDEHQIDYLNNPWTIGAYKEYFDDYKWKGER